MKQIVVTIFVRLNVRDSFRSTHMTSHVMHGDFRVYSKVVHSFNPKSTKLVKMTTLNAIFHVVVLVPCAISE